MASISTNTLARTIGVTQTFLRNAPLVGIGGNPVEPGMSIGDWVRGFILSPPFAWRWNRGTGTFNTKADGTQDYVVTGLTNFGWLEKATIDDGKGNANSIVEMEIKLNLAEDSSGSGPRWIAARADDDSGDITLRVHPSPEAVYTVRFSYQMAPPKFANLTDTWAPIPDYLSHIYSLGFMAKAYEYYDDQRYPFTFQQFLRQLVAVNEGLTDSQKAIFLSEFLDMVRDQQGVGLRSQFGHQGRAGF